MPEKQKYECVNIGAEGYPVWLTLSEKATIVSIEPTIYADKTEYFGVIKSLVTTVTLVVAGCCVEVKSPLPIDSVCRILGFVWDQGDEAVDPAPPEEPKPEGGPQ